MEAFFAVLGLWSVMVREGLLVKKLSEAPWFKK